MTPPSNTGVNKTGRITADERLVIEGGKVKVVCAERQRTAESGVVVDYLRCTVRKDALLSLEGVEAAADDWLTQSLALKVAGLLGFELGEERKGRDYYDFTWTIQNALGKEVGSVSGGGVTQRDTFCITLKGEACSFAAKGWERALHAFLEPLDPRVTRVDLAKDFLGGELTIEEVVHCYRCGEFDYRNRRPSYTVHGAWSLGGLAANVLGESRMFKVDDVAALEGGHSRTFQVGQRDSGKLLRAYEKGHQFRMLDDAWLRVEVELRNVNRIIPFDALIRPADFFSGAYEFCNLILDRKPEPQRVPTGRAVGERTVDSFAVSFERSSAPTIRLAVAALGVERACEWFLDVATKHINRPVPRRLSGLSHYDIETGFERWLNKLSGSVPAGPAPIH